MRRNALSTQARHARPHAATRPMRAPKRPRIGAFAGVPTWCSGTSARFLIGVEIVPPAPRAGELSVAKEFPFEIALDTDIPMSG